MLQSTKLPVNQDAEPVLPIGRSTSKIPSDIQNLTISRYFREREVTQEDIDKMKLMQARDNRAQRRSEVRQAEREGR